MLGIGVGDASDRPIEYACPSCRATVSVSQRAAGKTLPCPNCGQKSVVPSLTFIAATGASPFDFAAGSAPSEHEKRRVRSSQRPYFVPIWGTFLILLTVFLAVVSWGSWKFYDHYYRQPRLRAEREHREAEEKRRFWINILKSDRPSQPVTAEEALAAFRLLVEETKQELPRHPLLPRLLAAFHKYEQILSLKDMGVDTRTRHLENCQSEIIELLEKMEDERLRARIDRLKRETDDIHQGESADVLEKRFQFEEGQREPPP